MAFTRLLLSVEGLSSRSLVSSQQVSGHPSAGQFKSHKPFWIIEKWSECFSPAFHSSLVPTNCKCYKLKSLCLWNLTGEEKLTCASDIWWLNKSNFWTSTSWNNIAVPNRLSEAHIASFKLCFGRWLSAFAVISICTCPESYINAVFFHPPRHNCETPQRENADS